MKLDGKRALLTPAPAQAPSSLQAIQSLLKYDGPVVPVSAMRVTDHALSEGCDDFVTLDAKLARRALREPKAVPTVIRL